MIEQDRIEGRAGEGWIEAPNLPGGLEGSNAWRWMDGRVDLTVIPRGYDRRWRACGGIYFWPLPQPDPPAAAPSECRR
jgi:hypothetical protein